MPVSYFTTDAYLSDRLIIHDLEWEQIKAEYNRVVDILGRPNFQFDPSNVLRIVRIGVHNSNRKPPEFAPWPVDPWWKRVLKRLGFFKPIFTIERQDPIEWERQQFEQDRTAHIHGYQRCPIEQSDIKHWGKITFLRRLEADKDILLNTGGLLCKFDNTGPTTGQAGYLVFRDGKVQQYVVTRMS